jgi:hypothetical protein
MTEQDDPNKSTAPGGDNQGETPAQPEATEPPLERELGSAVAAAASTGRRAWSEIVHSWIPLGIALASVLAALMGWQASLADESANHNEEISRQDLVQQQELQIQDNDAVNQDLNTYGQFAQISALAHSELGDASKVGGGAGAQLSVSGQADLGIARYLGKEISILNYAFDPSNPTGNPNLRSDGTLAPGHPYDPEFALQVQENADSPLHGLSPGSLLKSADSDRDHGVDLEGIAALFVAVMVLLTLGALATGAAKVWLATSGAMIATAGLVLFAIVELS